MKIILRHILTDLLKNKTVLMYGVLLGVVTWSLLALENNAIKGTASVLNIVLIIVPLVSMVFSNTYFYNSYEFVALLLSQTVKRSQVFWGLYIGLGLSLMLAFVLGVGVPLLLSHIDYSSVTLLFMGVLLTWIFSGIAIFIASASPDKAKGIGITLMVWLYFSLLYDGIVLMILFAFREYPLEKAMMVLAMLNPVDLSRIAVLLTLDYSALMGFTGAIYHDFLGTFWGIFSALVILLAWGMWPMWAAFRVFIKKDW